MKKTTSERLKEVMQIKRLQQADIYRLCQPLCLQYNVKMERNVISQYVNGKYLPTQKKLTILALALEVNEAWLMGYDVPMEREEKNENAPMLIMVRSKEEKEFFTLFQSVPEEKQDDILKVLKTTLELLKK